MSNTILAGNTAEEGPDCLGIVSSLGRNLIGIDSDCGFIPSEGDTMGTEAQPIDPRLGSLAANGGPTATNALLPGSPAIDASADGSWPSSGPKGRFTATGQFVRHRGLRAVTFFLKPDIFLVAD